MAGHTRPTQRFKPDGILAPRQGSKHEGLHLTKKLFFPPEVFCLFVLILIFVGCVYMIIGVFVCFLFILFTENERQKKHKGYIGNEVGRIKRESVINAQLINV